MVYFRLLVRQWFLGLLLVVCILGFALPGPGVWLKARAPYAVKVAVMAALFLSSYGLPLGEIAKSLFHWRALALIMLASYVLMPLYAWLAARIFFATGDDLAIGMLVMTAMPCTLASALIWTRLAGGSDALALAGTIITNILNFIIAPGIFKLALGASMTIPLPAVTKDLFITLLLPIAAGQLARLLAAGLAERLRLLISVINRLIVLATVWLSVSKAAQESSGLLLGRVLLVSLLVLAVHAATLASGWLLSLRLPRAERIACAIAGSQKTLIVAIYALDNFMPGAGMAIVPVVLFHALQLVFDSMLVEIWARKRENAG